MKKFLFAVLALLSFSFSALSQSESAAARETARGYMQKGDYDNAIIVLTRAIEQDKNNLDLQKDLLMNLYLKRDFTRALPAAKSLAARSDADVMTYQLAGNVYKALQEVKEAEKMYQTALKRFPQSGPLYSEYGELLWEKKDFSAIDQWEKGIEKDPGYAGNYYNAARYYYYTKDKVWCIVYGETYVNMESLSERATLMKEMVYKAYKEKLFSSADITKDAPENTSAFGKAFLATMQKQSSLASQGITPEVLTMIRTRFLLDWYNSTYSQQFPSRLFDHQQQLLKEGMFEAYDQWLFGMVDNLADYDSWTKDHAEEYAKFTRFQKNRIFKVPAGQYYRFLK